MSKRVKMNRVRVNLVQVLGMRVEALEMALVLACHRKAGPYQVLTAARLFYGFLKRGK